MITPRHAIIVPTKSYISGIIFSKKKPHNSAMTMNIPPYAAYTLPKLEG